MISILAVALLASNAALGGASAATATPAGPAGVYSSVRYNRESGDVLGMEVEIRAGDYPSIIVTDCEGQCSGGKSWPLTINGERLTFSVGFDAVDQDGRPVQLKPVRYVGVLHSLTLTLTSPDVPEIREKLRRVSNPKPGQTAKLGCGAAHC